MRKIIGITLGLGFLFINPGFSYAEIATGASMSSTNFRILDSQQTIFGGTASSSSGSFILTGSIGGLAIGSASLANFGLRGGFLYYPKVTAPTLNTATAGDSQVTLSWTAAAAYQGWIIGSYDLCFKSSGSYSCSNVGKVTSATKSSLSNGTTYTFEIEAEDGVGNIIATSNEKSATPAAAATTTSSTSSGGGGGGGGGGGSAYVATSTPATGTGSVILKGTAYPSSTVSVYEDGALAASVRAGAGAVFEIQLNSVAAGQRTIGIDSTDANGRKSITSNFIVTITANTTVTLNDIFIAPTIDINTYYPPKGSVLKIFGQTAPQSNVNVHIASNEIITPTIADSDGAYELNFDTKVLAEDSHTAKSRATLSDLVSPFSRVLQFFLGVSTAKLKTSDLSGDGKVDITDFSILLYWWGTKNPRGLAVADINKDGKVDIVDFSIMLFQWNR